MEPDPEDSPNLNHNNNPSPSNSHSQNSRNDCDIGPDDRGGGESDDDPGEGGAGNEEHEPEPEPFYNDESEDEQMGGPIMAGRCPDHIKAFAYMRVDWKNNEKALKPGRPVDHLYWPDVKVTAPNPTFFNGPYHRRATIFFWAPSIFWPWYVRRVAHYYLPTFLPSSPII